MYVFGYLWVNLDLEWLQTLSFEIRHKLTVQTVISLEIFYWCFCDPSFKQSNLQWSQTHLKTLEGCDQQRGKWWLQSNL